ncbi:MAG: amidohydrolase, partial [Candidatus Neomarinimicrobiota bacterium]
MRIALLVASITILSAGLAAQPASSLSATVREFVLVDAPGVALTHVQVVDGTGAPAASDQTIVLRAGRIAAVGPSDTVAVPGG